MVIGQHVLQSYDKIYKDVSFILIHHLAPKLNWTTNNMLTLKAKETLELQKKKGGKVNHDTFYVPKLD